MVKKVIFCILCLCTLTSLSPLSAQQTKHRFSRADSLRGALSPFRSCYDINYYHLDIKVDIDQKSISGSNEFKFTATKNFKQLQFDLFSNLKIEKVLYKGKALIFKREFNAVFVTFPKIIKSGTDDSFTVYYSGNPVIAKNPPWDGGFIFTKDKSGNPWVSVACQGFGASSWWPTKDHQSDEPDSVLISISIPKRFQCVSNGKQRSTIEKPGGYRQFNWFVANPINNYDVSLYIGKYAHWTDKYMGEKGKLSLDYWSVAEDSTKARPHWDADVKPMLKSFEYWFGPYPFYEDGYKLVQAPFLGMEHQSAVGYGNEFEMGYRGRDLSGTGWGKKFDFITVHESGHEWFGNNITSKDIADMWIHESFTNYSEALFIESLYGKRAANEYVIGIRKNIVNDIPIIGPYNVNQEGSGDMYYKGANMIHTIRQLINDDERFRGILRDLNKTYYHKTVTTKEIEDYIATNSGLNLNKVFDQYLRHTKVPVLEYKITDSKLSYRWQAEVENFDMPLRVSLKKDAYTLIYPTADWKTIPIASDITNNTFTADPNFYVKLSALN